MDFLFFSVISYRLIVTKQTTTWDSSARDSRFGKTKKKTTLEQL